jgi:glycerol-3-phosphate dehydrogenase (NAD(P)+)
MKKIVVAGSGAFGTALAIALATGGNRVVLSARDPRAAAEMQANRTNAAYLPNITFPQNLEISAQASVLTSGDVILLAVPTQSLRAMVEKHRTQLAGKTCVLCCKGVETGTGLLPSQTLAEIVPDANIAVLTGPGFAAEIARGLPTALTLAANGPDANGLQTLLSTQTLRLYLSADPVGAQLGGALKNVIAIASGIAIGAGLGESARAAVMTRGYAEMLRLAVNLGADPTTLSGLSGLGDLALTCTSQQSRNFSLGHELGRGGGITEGTTFEGVATARATMTLAKRRGIEMPLTGIVTAVLEKDLTIGGAVKALLSRPLKAEGE